MCFTASVVPVHGCPGFCLLLLNIFLPGLGTMISSCMGRDGIVCEQLLVGLLQMLLSGFLIGWIWSIWWGCLIWGKDNSTGQNVYHKP